MSFNELALNVQKDFDFMNAFFERADIFSDSSYHEYQHNLNQIEVRILTESGNDSDREYLVEAAEEGFVERTKKFISKLIDTVVEHITKIGISIGKFFEDVKVKTAMVKIDHLIKSGKLKGKTIEIDDTKALQEFYEKKKAETLKYIYALRAKGASIDEATLKACDKLINEFEADKKRALRKEKISLTIEAAKAYLSALIKKVTDVTKRAASDMKAAVDNIDWSAVAGKVAETLRKLVNFLAKLCKEAAELIWSGINKCFNGIKSLGGGKTEEPEEEKKEDEKEEEKPESSEEEKKEEEPKEEGKEEEKKEEEKPAEESTLDPEIAKEIDNIMAYLEYGGPEIPEAKDPEVETVESYLAAMEAELFGPEEEEVKESSSAVDEYINKLIETLHK